jgi:hypothetical protein
MVAVDKTLPDGLAALMDRLLPVVRRFCVGEYGIALGGAHAKGVDDAASDVDVYLFARQVLPNEERARLVGEIADDPASIISWGQVEPFVQAGTDFYLGPQKVECWLRNIKMISATIADCRSGVVKHDLVTWTVMGFYNHCALSDLDKMIPLEDPHGILARWKELVSEYPPKLRAAILAEYLRGAKFWPGNFHYLSAVERCDVIYVTGIVQQVVNNLIQVIFALNRVYFPGEKKLDVALERLATKPAGFTQCIKGLVFPGVSPDVAYLRRQSHALTALVSEVEALVAEDSRR